MDDRTQKVFDFASDLTKQVITLASGIIAVTVTFNNGFVSADSTPKSAVLFLMLSWGFYLLSIIFGIISLMALTGQLQRAATSVEETKENAHTPRINVFNIRVGSGVQLISFLLATVCILIFGGIIIWNK